MKKTELVKMWEETFSIKLWQLVLGSLILSTGFLVGAAFLLKWVLN